MRRRSITVTEQDKREARTGAHPRSGRLLASPMWWAKFRIRWIARFRRDRRRGWRHRWTTSGEHRAEVCLYCRAGMTPCPVGQWHESTLPF